VEGEGTYPVQVATLPDNLQLVHVSPREAAVKLEAIIQKQLPVELVTRGNPAPAMLPANRCSVRYKYW